MSELVTFKNIEKISAIDISEQNTANYIFHNKTNFKQSDKPDLVFENPILSLDSIGIEHTEVSIFKQGRRGAEIRKSHKTLSSEVLKVELEYFEISCVDIQPHYKNKLRLNNGETFLNNIASAINLKSKKAKNYRKLNFNILWIETEEFLEFHRTFLLNKKIKNAILKSPFDSILIGNSSITFYISKNILRKANIPSNNNLIIHTNKDFNQTYKALKDVQAEITAMGNSTKISKNITEHYTAYIRIKQKVPTPLTTVSKLYVNNLELTITNMERGNNGTWNINVVENDIILNFQVSSKEIKFSHSFKANKGDTFHLSLASKKGSFLQQCLTGIINLIIQENDTIEHFKHIPSQENIDKWNIKAKEVD